MNKEVTSQPWDRDRVVSPPKPWEADHYKQVNRGMLLNRPF